MTPHAWPGRARAAATALALLAAGSPARTIQAAPKPAPTCEVRWSADARRVALVDAAVVRVRSAADGALLSERRATAGVRFLDVSLPNGLVLQRRVGRLELVPLRGGPARFSAALAAASSVDVAEDGTRGVITVVNVPEDQRVYTQESTGVPNESLRTIDLATGRVRDVDIPMFSAGGSDAYPDWIRRRAVQVRQSRIATGFFDYADASEEPPLFRVESCFGAGSELVSRFFGADVDAPFRTAVVARVPCERTPHRPTIEVLRRKPGERDFTLARAWPLTGRFLALWLTPDGGRAIVRTRSKRGVVDTVYDTRTGRRRGTTSLGGECFAFSPDGSRVAEKRGAAVRVSRLP